MRKLSIIALLLMFVSIGLSSCRSQKQACAAYSQADQVEGKDIPG